MINRLLAEEFILSIVDLEDRTVNPIPGKVPVPATLVTPTA